MAITPLSTDLNHIQALADQPNATSGLTPAQVKAAFDQSANDIKTYINDTLISGIETEIDAQVSATPGLNRQIVINGNMDVWQTGTSFAVGTGMPYTADQWQAFRGLLVAGMTVSQQDGSGVYGSKYCLRAKRDSANTAINKLAVIQSIESVNSQKFRGEKAAISFYARAGANYSAASSVLTVKLSTGTGTDQNGAGTVTGLASPIDQNVTLTTSWQRFSIATSAVLADTVNQLFVDFSYIPTGTAGANDYFEIVKIQVNSGDQALPFQMRSYAEELALCKRFCYVITDATNVNLNIGLGTAAVTTVAIITVPLPVQMRVVPTLVATAADWALYDGNAAGIVLSAIGIQAGQSSVMVATIRATVAAGLTLYRPYNLESVAINKLMTFDARL